MYAKSIIVMLHCFAKGKLITALLNDCMLFCVTNVGIVCSVQSVNLGTVKLMTVPVIGDRQVQSSGT